MGIAPILKSNAYGHGLTTVAKLLDTEGVSFFMVDSLYEAQQLRHAGVHSRILVMGYVRPMDMVRSRLKNVDFALVDIEQLRELSSIATHTLRIHLKLDTGMHRHGIPEGDFDEALTLLASTPSLQVVGVCSHFADADNEDETHTKEQVALWNKLLPRVQGAFPSISYIHLSATKGVRFAKGTGTNVIRLGMGLYGIDTSPNDSLSLMPVLSMHSTISSIRSVQKGEWVGYNATYTASTPRRIATVPAGYFEGVDRALSGTGFIEVREVMCPIVGRISMNMSSIDVTDVPGVSVGDVVTIMSRNPKDPNSVASVAKSAHTTPYVILVHIPQHLRRVVEI